MVLDKLKELTKLNKQLLEVHEELDNSGHFDPDYIETLNTRSYVLRDGIKNLLEKKDGAEVYKVESSFDGFETLDSIVYLRPTEVRELAEYYHYNSDETEPYDFNHLDICIDFIKRVDKVDGETDNPEKPLKMR